HVVGRVAELLVPAGDVLGARLGVLVEVVAGAERAAGAAEDDHAHVLVLARGCERVRHRGDQLSGECVQRLRPIHRETTDRPEVFGKEDVLSHGAASYTGTKLVSARLVARELALP